MSTPKKKVAPPKPAAPPPAATFDPVAEFADLPPEVLEGLERRLVNPDVPGSIPIRLRDEPVGVPKKWHLRWVNTTVPYRYHQMTQGFYYVPVKWTELVTKDDIADRFDGVGEFVARGERGVERLLKMPMHYYQAIKKRQGEARAARETPAQLKKDLQTAAAARAGNDDTLGMSGDEAAALVGNLVGEIKTHTETLVAPTDEPGRA